MLLAILAFWWGYKKGRDSGRNAILWSVICGGTFIGIQLAVGLGVGILIGVGTQVWGWDANALDKFSILISIASVIPAVIVLMIMFKYLDRIPDEPVMTAPPPPPKFGGGE